MKAKKKGILCSKQFSYISGVVDYFNEHPELDIVSHSFDSDDDIVVLYYRYENNTRNKHKNND